MNSEKIRIFIVSSLDALILAESLRDDLTGDFFEARIWSEESDRQVLARDIRDFDFGLIILTKNDVLSMELDGKRKQQARDNCLYMSGIFVGSLEQRDRCFLVSSVRKSALPVDCQGLNYLYFDEPVDLTDPDQCKKALGPESRGKAGSEILRIVKEKGGIIREEVPPSFLSFEEILGKENLKAGDLKKPDEGRTVVVVCDILPIENFTWARQIKENLDQGVQYFYFFQAEVDGARRICRLLQMILLADILKNDPTKVEAVQDCYEKIKEYKDQVIENLEKIRREDSLNIYFSPVAPQFNFRIHNAHSDDARIYLRYGSDRFVDWSGSGNAFSIYNWLRRYKDPNEEKVVFCSNKFYDLDEPKNELFREILNREITLHFPGFYDEVKQICGLN